MNESLPSLREVIYDQNLLSEYIQQAEARKSGARRRNEDAQKRLDEMKAALNNMLNAMD